MNAQKNHEGKRERNKSEIKERILKAALAAFQKKGFDRSTTKEIAQKAGVAEGTIFNYFKTKDDIALYFFEKEIDHVMSTFETDRRLKMASLEEKLFALIQQQLDYLAPYQSFLGAALAQALKPGSKLNPFSLESQELRLRYLKFVQGIFEESGEAGAAAWWAPQAFWAYYMGVLLYWINDGSPNKENTLAFLDRSLKIGMNFLRQGSLS